MLFSVNNTYPQSPDWPVYRGMSDLSGKSEWTLASDPKLLWNWNSGSTTRSSPVISEGVIYFGTDKGALIACSADGKLLWKKSDTDDPLEAPPMVSGKTIIYSSSDGTLHASDSKTGRAIWTYKTDNQIVGSANFWNSADAAYLTGMKSLFRSNFSVYFLLILPIES